MARIPLEIQFGGGVNNKDADFDIQDNQASDCLNVVFDETQSVITRDGYTTYGNDLGANLCSGAGKYYYQNGTGGTTRSLFQVVNTDVYLYVAGTWTAQGRALTANTSAELVQANNELYLFNGVNDVQNLNNTTWSTLASGAPMSGANTRGRYAVYKGGMLFVAGTNANPSRVYVSGDANESLDTPETFTGGWAYDVGLSDGTGKITGLAVLSDYVVVFKEYGIYLLTGPTGGTQSIIERSKSIGACSQRSIASNENYLLFQACDGHIYSFDTVNVIKQSEIIQGSIDNVNTTQLAKSNAVIYEEKGKKYILNYASGTSTTPDSTLVLDLDRSAIGSQNYNEKVWLPWDGINSSVMVTYSDSGREKLYFGEATSDSKFYQMFSGTNDNGTAIDAYYETKNFSGGEKERDKKYKYLYVSAKAVGDWNLKLQYSVDGGSFSNTTPETISLASLAPTFTFTLPATLDEGFLASSNTVVVPAVSRFIKIRFANNTLNQYFHVYGMTLMFRFGKLRKRIASTS